MSEPTPRLALASGVETTTVPTNNNESSNTNSNSNTETPPKPEIDAANLPRSQTKDSAPPQNSPGKQQDVQNSSDKKQDVQNSTDKGQDVARDTTRATTNIEDENELSESARLERLGRQRPDIFKTAWAEFGFGLSVVMSQILTEYFVSGFTVILPTLTKELDIPTSALTWPTGAFSLVVSAFLLIFGRLADMYGGRLVYLAGTLWLAVWSLIAGFSQNEIILDVCRALQGLGPSAFLPTSLMLLGSAYRPGVRKNIVFSVYGACAPLGFYIGIFFAGVAGEYTTWGWYFWIGAILSALTTLIAWISIPSDLEGRREMGIKMDWWGSALIVSGLILVVFAVTDGSHAPQGWKTPYIYVTLIIGVLLLCLAFYVEGWVAEMPLVPADIFHPKYMKPLMLALFFFYGTLGNFYLYASFYMENIMGASPIQLTAWFSPAAVGGVIIATVNGFFLHNIPGDILIFIAGAAWIVAPLLFAIAPEGASYWAYVFPAMLASTIGIDTVFSITNIFITTNMPTRRQGLAGGLINSLLQLGIAFFLGVADVIVTSAENAGRGEKQSYKDAFWFQVALSAFALLVMVAFVRVGSAKSDYTADEREVHAAREEEEEEQHGGAAAIAPEPAAAAS